MLTFEQALRIVLDSARELGTEQVDIAHALNRVLAEDVRSDIDIPPFDKAVMDGFACRRQDLANELIVIETIPAGRPAEKTIGPNLCARIMTGAVVPDGADCVIMKEYVQMSGEGKIRFVGEKTADNICVRGEDAKAGDTVLRKGALLRAQHIAVLASAGCVAPLVARTPRVGVIATGDELVEPTAKPGASQIRNSNSYQLAAQVEQMGAPAKNYGAAADNTEAIESFLKRACEENDVVLFSGGVSAGEYDLVKTVLKKAGVSVLFEKVAAEPGRPMAFGIRDNAFCFALPGNPVSGFVMCELLVKPFLYKMMGHDFKPPVSHCKLAKTITRKSAQRDSWLPVVFTEDGRAERIEYHGSAHINALCDADGLLCIPAGVRQIKQDSIAAVRHI
ncbi:MAG TPA: gephyrin-like molybdotransferase Glp [Sedimentisphaerales bacterium]|nr:gephyrin-like molybdotransferase Glp [Sedimentisphaerales bacterium]